MGGAVTQHFVRQSNNTILSAGGECSLYSIDTHCFVEKGSVGSVRVCV
jgi:hypothetical protein